MRYFAALFLCLAAASAAEPVTIRVNAAARIGPYRPIWSYFGYDEPNYTYMPDGRKLVGELASLSSVPVHIRTHFLLATGDGAPDFKWGSTNAYTEDTAGKPVYDWKIVDRIFDTYVHAGARPFVEIGFMPEALSTHPDPYRPVWSPGATFARYYTGWSYPPKDYARWSGLVSALVRHSVERYGRSDVESWYWEVWNEPDGSYWHASPEEYDKLYDYTAAAVKRVLPDARVGGPATTGPAGARAAAFLRQFLEHCANGRNSVTGETGAPLDFISYHAKGRPTIVGGHVRMGIAKNIEDVWKGIDIVSAFPKLRSLPIVLSESDPEGCAACSARVYPHNAYRNGPLYACYTALMFDNITRLAARTRANIEGMLTWAFEFEGQPYFDGFRTLATNGIDKPVLNFFRMAGLMRGDRVAVESSGALGLDEIARSGVTGRPDIGALAARSENGLWVLAWNYHDDDVPAPDAPVRLEIAGLPGAAHRVLVRHYRIDRDHSNAYTVWKAMGSPRQPAPEQRARLEAAGRLQMLDSPAWLTAAGGKAALDFPLPRQAVSLVEFTW